MIRIIGKELGHISEKRVNNIIMACCLMLFSIYAPYNRNVSYIYQISVMLYLIYISKNYYDFFFSLVLLTTTRDYIAVSTAQKFRSYYGINGLILSLTLILIGVRALVFKKWKLHLDMTGICLIVFSGLMLFSYVFVESRSEYNNLFIPICFIYLFSCNEILSEEDIIIAKLAFIFAGFFLSLKVIPYIINYTASPLFRTYSIFIDNNQLLVDRNYQAMYCLICATTGLSFLFQYSKRLGIIGKALIIACTAADIFIIAMGGSRSAILALVIYIALFLLMFNQGLPKFIGVVMTGMAMGLYSIQMGVFDSILQRFAHTDVLSGNGRITLWSEYIDQYLKGNIIQLILGRGITGISVIGSPAHNTFISILFCFGLAGFISFTWLIGTIVVRFIRYDQRLELIILLAVIAMANTIEPYYRIEFALYIVLTARISLYHGGNSNEVYSTSRSLTV